MPKGLYDRTKLRHISRVDYTGMVFGFLTAIKLLRWELEKQGHGGRQVWLFKCQCGNEVEKKATQMVASVNAGGIPSCGCRTYNKRLPPSVAPLRSVIRRYRKGAEKRNLEFELTDEQCLKLFSMNCHWCNTAPSGVARDKYTRQAHALYNGMDRVDNDLGYIIGNVVPCCSLCNWMKNTLSGDEFVNHIAIIFNAQFGDMSKNKKQLYQYFIESNFHTGETPDS